MRDSHDLTGAATDDANTADVATCNAFAAVDGVAAVDGAAAVDDVAAVGHVAAETVQPSTRKRSATCP